MNFPQRLRRLRSTQNIRDMLCAYYTINCANIY
jgi:hypothetical protein